MSMAASTAKTFSRKVSRTCARDSVGDAGVWLRSIYATIPQVRGADHFNTAAFSASSGSLAIFATMRRDSSRMTPLIAYGDAIPAVSVNGGGSREIVRCVTSCRICSVPASALHRREEAMNATETAANAERTKPASFQLLDVLRTVGHRVLPLTGIGLAVILNAVWIALLGYGVLKLL